MLKINQKVLKNYYIKLLALPKAVLILIGLVFAGTSYAALNMLTSGPDPILPVKIPLVSQEETFVSSIADTVKDKVSDDSTDADGDNQDSTDPNNPGTVSSEDSGSTPNPSTQNKDSTEEGGDSTGGGETGGGEGGGEAVDEPAEETNDPPSAPSGASVSRLRPVYADISFTRASDPDGIAKHELLRNGVVEKSSNSSSITKFRTNFVAEGSSYAYTVRAVDTKGAVSQVSNSVAVNFPVDNTAPSPPTNFRISENIAESVTFSWDRSTDNYYTADEHEINYVISSPSDGSYYYTWILFFDHHQTYWFDEPGTTHNVYIQAMDLSDNISAKVGPITFTAK